VTIRQPFDEEKYAILSLRFLMKFPWSQSSGKGESAKFNSLSLIRRVGYDLL